MQQTQVALTVAVALSLVAVTGCGKKDDSSKAKADPPAKPADKPPAEPPRPSPFPEMKVTVNGQAVPIHSIQAYWVGDEAVKLELSSIRRPCNKHPSIRQNAPGEHYFKVWLGKQLDTAGKAQWAIVQAYFSGRTKQGKLGELTLTATPNAVGKHVEGTLSFNLKSFPRRKKPAAELSASGKFKAINCRLPPPKRSFSARTGDLTMTVAGHKRKVTGATLKLRGDSARIQLATSPRSCLRSSGMEQGAVRLVVKAGAVKRLAVRGTWFPTQMTHDPKPGELKLELGKSDGNAVDVTITGKTTVLGYPIELSGKINAIDCTNKPKKRPKLVKP